MNCMDFFTAVNTSGRARMRNSLPLTGTKYLSLNTPFMGPQNYIRNVSQYSKVKHFYMLGKKCKQIPGLSKRQQQMKRLYI